MRSSISPRKQIPAAAGRLRARITVPVREGGITFLATAPCSPLARRRCRSSSAGRCGHGERRRSSPGVRRRQLPLPRCPLPPAPGGQEQPGRRSRNGHNFPLLFFFFFPFRNSPLGQSCVAQPVSKAAEKAEIAALLTAQQCPDRRAHGSFPSPPRHVGSSGGRRQSGPGSPGRPQGGGRAGFRPSLAFRLSEAAACCKRATPRRCRAVPGLRASLTQRGEPPRPPLPPLRARRDAPLGAPAPSVGRGCSGAALRAEAEKGRIS